MFSKELVSMGSVRVDRAGETYTVSFVGGDVDEILEKIADE